MKNFHSLVALCFVFASLASYALAETPTAPTTNLYCNIDSRGGVFHFDTRGALYEEYGKMFVSTCFTSALEEAKFDCSIYPAEFVARQSKTAELALGFLRENQKFEPKSVVFCEIMPKLTDLWVRTYNNGLPTTMRKLEDGSYSSTTKSGVFFIFLRQPK